MKRTKFPNQPHYDIGAEPIVLSKALLDLLLKENYPGDLIALYCFYYYTAKWQRTNQIKCTIHYTSKGLKWSEQRTRNRKRVLIAAGLVEDMKERDETERITGHYIKVNFIWNRNTLHSHPHEKPQCGVYPMVNTLNNNKEIISVGVRETPTERATKYLPLAKELSNIISTQKNMKHTSRQLKAWANEMRLLEEQNGVQYERIKSALTWYASHAGGQYIPVIESGNSLRNKFINLEAAMKRKRNGHDNQPDEIIQDGIRWYLEEDGTYKNKAGKVLIT